MTEVDRITTLSPTSSTDEAMALLLVSGLSGAPVVVDVSDDDATHKILVGVVSSFDFLQREAFEGSLLPMEGSRANVEKYVHAAQKICGQIVQDIMTPANQVRFVRGSKGAFDSLHGNRWFFFAPASQIIVLTPCWCSFFGVNQVKTVTPDTPMREAAAIMSESKLHRLPVVDSAGGKRLVGVLSSADVMKDLLHIVRNLPPATAAAAGGDDTAEDDVAREASSSSSSSGGSDASKVSP